ncbi:MAG: hypothetical protein HRU26_15145 [Psychroserpens sp.]|nr:hypothetical protein [Psychroserpens sp.]
MSIRLVLVDEGFDYPQTGNGEGWGEEATGWAEKVTEVINSVISNQDISLTEAVLINGSSGIVNGMAFSPTNTQRIEVKGVINRVYTAISAKPEEAEEITIKGSYNGSDFLIGVTSIGDDTGVTLDVDTAGQFNYVANNKVDTESITIKFKGTAITF